MLQFVYDDPWLNIQLSTKDLQWELVSEYHEQNDSVLQFSTMLWNLISGSKNIPAPCENQSKGEWFLKHWTLLAETYSCYIQEGHSHVTLPVQ